MPTQAVPGPMVSVELLHERELIEVRSEPTKAALPGLAPAVSQVTRRSPP